MMHLLKMMMYKWKEVNSRSLKKNIRSQNRIVYFIFVKLYVCTCGHTYVCVYMYIYQNKSRRILDLYLDSHHQVWDVKSKLISRYRMEVILFFMLKPETWNTKLKKDTVLRYTQLSCISPHSIALSQ